MAPQDQLTSPLIIAIDGPAGAGKGTLAQAIARLYNLAFLDTGLLYRAAARKILQQGFDLSDQDQATAVSKTLSITDLHHIHEIRTMEMAEAASKIAVYPGVRQALLEMQQNFAKNPPQPHRGAVLDGRDIGTVVCPFAPIKIYVTASAEVRAERRMKELQGKGISCIYEEILKEIQIRDDRDMNRSTAPLRPAAEAIVLDSSLKTPQEMVEMVSAIIDQHLALAK